MLAARLSQEYISFGIRYLFGDLREFRVIFSSNDLKTCFYQITIILSITEACPNTDSWMQNYVQQSSGIPTVVEYLSHHDAESGV